jgi:hypothetical protein
MNPTRLCLVLALAACTDHRASEITGTQSLRVTLVAPGDPGSVVDRLPDGARDVTIDVEALDPQGQIDETFTAQLSVHAQFLGTLTPPFGTTPIHTFQITGGRATGVSFELPQAFGPTTLWIDNSTGFGPAYEHGAVTGTSDTLWYRDPFIVDLQTPERETALDALSRTPLQDKQVSIGGAPGSPQASRASRYGDRGRLVVTSVFTQGYTVSDVECADAAGSPPCTTQAYDHILVFTFSAPRDQDFRSLELGQVISGFSGGLTEFNGLTEIGFPQTFAPKDDSGAKIIDLARLPPPVKVELSWFNSLSDPDGMINFERNEAAPILIENGMVCPLDDAFETFKQWKIDPAGQCAPGNRNVINVITTGIAGIDPPALVGQTLPRVVGVLRPVNIGSFNVWIIFPRSASDLTLQ